MFYYVYILQSLTYTEKHYIGFTENLKNRLEKHNEGGSKYTSKYSPWKISTTIAFTEKEKALSFEKYLKSHSGKAFSNKHFN
ncbi:MAG: GIY-YIG nuclease family protein [Ignavibacteriaceae bacterium]